MTIILIWKLPICHCVPSAWCSEQHLRAGKISKGRSASFLPPRLSTVQHLSDCCFDVLVLFYYYYSFIFWLRWVFAVACRLSAVAESGGFSLADVHRLCIGRASLAVECRL